MEEKDNHKLVKASPTKDFFIFMLTKDIDIIDAVADLVDNCIDGARNLKPDSNYRDLFVKITLDYDHFSIIDNCGGIDINVARKYAFRFGRARDAQAISHSIGRFGIGMKRALFKIGNYFQIESTAKHSRFVLQKDIREWAENETEWDFEFSEYEENLNNSENERGTKIYVTQLHSNISDEFGLENFKTRLKLKLESANQSSLEQGIVISLNDIYLSSSPPKLIKSNEIIPAYKTLKREDGRVSIKIYAGLVSERRQPKKAGWNIFCNGRLILEADRSSVTGWGENIPEYHNDYARFRGYVYFDADDPSLLPWNTTKSDVDADSQIYKSVKLEMTNIMNPVVKFLNRVVSDKAEYGNDESSPLEQVISEARNVKLSEIENEAIFQAPDSIAERPQVSRISFSRKKADVDKAKKLLGVSINKEVGERVFDYFMRLECDDYEE